MTEETLDPCPFCEGNGKIFISKKDKYKILPNYVYTPACCVCGASLPFEDSESKAIEAWNRRV